MNCDNESDICTIGCEDNYHLELKTPECVFDDVEKVYKWTNLSECMKDNFESIFFNNFNELRKKGNFHCVEDKCLLIDLIGTKNMNFYCQDAFVGQTCKTKCRKGYVKIGKNPLCGAYGKWKMQMHCIAAWEIVILVLLYTFYCFFAIVITVVFYKKRNVFLRMFKRRILID